MFTTTTNFRETATIIAASALCTTLALALSNQAAHAATPDSFARSVQSQLSRNTAYVDSHASGVATVAVSIGADGKISDAHLVGSTGSSRMDDEALRSAKAVNYPANGKPRKVAVVIRFNDAAAPAPAASRALVRRYLDNKE